MDLKDPFEKLEAIRIKIKANEHSHEFGEVLAPLPEYEVKLEQGGLDVDLDEIVNVGPFITYKGEILAILYIADTQSSITELEQDTPEKKAPKFHFAWCSTLETMKREQRFDRYVLSRSKNNLFRVEAKEEDRYLIKKFGERHFVENIRLYPCQNCLDKINYKDFSRNDPKPHRLGMVEDFSIKTYLDENDGTANAMKHMPKYTGDNAPSGSYTEDWVEISRKVREEHNWICSVCNVNMSKMRKGLHVHHINGVRSDNSKPNLKALCALCHKEVDRFHSTMHINDDIMRFVKSRRLSNT